MKLGDLKVGDVLPPLRWPPVSRLDLIKYAGASGDYNPIHTIDEAAEQAGLPGVIAHGMLTMGRMGKLFSPYFEEGFISSFSTRFTGMVFLNDEITMTAKLVAKTDDVLTFQVEAVKQTGDTAARATVVFKLYDAMD
ncbi:MaoC/PaaZ C-terminal domain-containing protein [Caenibacillus caldisaponilyticus]|uniref:MaoC/PaaZ C-terminal domain-containing protein n=1 Tax=Caenibacillus caldisaponilyticus TaxID=1674942 RepID=UPI000988881E|nr:MaoC/PaaZ C-terminal domain-containing protein [Caenibacillus caldisaponilyticus]